MGPLATLFGPVPESSSFQLNQGKTRVWNAASEKPPNLSAVQPQQGGVVLGAPLILPRIHGICAAAAAGKAPPAEHLAAAHPGPRRLAVGLATPVVLRFRSCKLPSP